MSSKRDFEDVDNGELPEPDSKRVKKQSSKSRSHQQQHNTSGTDPTSGQKYVFSDYHGGTTIPAGEESDFEDDGDAMAYLMSVRHEASGIPHVIIAPKVHLGPQLPPELQTADDNDNDTPAQEPDRSIYMDGTGDSRGWYEDGAYIGMPEEDVSGSTGPDILHPDEECERALHDAYFTSLMNQYRRLRQLLHTKPASHTRTRLSPSQITHAAPFGRHSSTVKTWSNLLRNTDPHPLQMALMSKESVMRILRVILGGKFLRRGCPLEERISSWLWALLARLPDQGELNYSEIGWIRDLGRRAVLLGRSFAEMAALREELAENGLGVNDAVDESSSDEEVVAEEATKGAILNSGDNGEYSDGEVRSAAGSKEELPREEIPVCDTAAVTDDQDPEDVAMELGSDSDADEGEIVEEDEEEKLETAKQKLLARLTDISPHSEQAAEQDAEQEARVNEQVNTRATLNMILTVAGEFYGQRDLLEFREPFAGL